MKDNLHNPDDMGKSISSVPSKEEQEYSSIRETLRGMRLKNSTLIPKGVSFLDHTTDVSKTRKGKCRKLFSTLFQL